jgi:hypothetical protein
MQVSGRHNEFNYLTVSNIVILSEKDGNKKSASCGSALDIKDVFITF